MVVVLSSRLDRYVQVESVVIDGNDSVVVHAIKHLHTTYTRHGIRDMLKMVATNDPGDENEEKHEIEDPITASHDPHDNIQLHHPTVASNLNCIADSIVAATNSLLAARLCLS